MKDVNRFLYGFENKICKTAVYFYFDNTLTLKLSATVKLILLLSSKQTKILISFEIVLFANNIN